jgi:hypothetical protein
MTATPEILHLIFTLIGLGLGWYIKHQSISVPSEVLSLVERLLAVKQHQQAQGYLQDLLHGAGMAVPPSAPTATPPKT